VISARCWFGSCSEPPGFRLVPADPSLLRPEACRIHLGELIASTFESYSLEALTVERIPPGALVEGLREEPPAPTPRVRRRRRGRFTGMQEVTRPDCGNGLLVAMYRYRLGCPEAVARAREIAMAGPCPICGQR
jgi:hypothetical protein